MGKLKKGHAYFRFTRWSSAFQSDLCGVYSWGHKRRGRRDPWLQEQEERTFFTLPCSCDSLLPAFKYTPLFCEYGVCDWKRSEAYNFPPPPTPSWHRKVAKTMFWEWAGAWKRCQRGSWPWRAQTPLVQEDRFHFSFRMCAPLRLHKGSLLSCHRLPGARNELPRGISSLCY